MDKVYDQAYINELIFRKRNSTISPEEEQILADWESGHPDGFLLLHMQHQDKLKTLKEKMYARILDGIHYRQSPVVTRRARYYYWTAACLLIGLGIAIGFFRRTATQPEPKVQVARILPGSNKATLTLGNGKLVNLSNAANGKLASQQTITISKGSGDQLTYQIADNTTPGQRLVYNTLTTPRGGQWPQLILSDGTKVMLDAESSLRYPVAFQGGERVVELSGQAYFEVAHDDQHPFKVKTAGQVIEDIGTAFNIKAYHDEPVFYTTLVHGSVRVAAAGHSVVLTPGQQAFNSGPSGKLEVKTVDVGDAIAWIKGQTSLEGESLPEIMRQISRWYDVDVIYQGIPSGRKFSGTMSRQVPLESLLNVLKFQDVHIELAGRKIIVKP